MIFYRRIRIPRISGNFRTCADSMHQALFPPKKESLGSRLATTPWLSSITSYILLKCKQGCERAGVASIKRVKDERVYRALIM